MSLPIVVCTVTGKSLPVLEASVKAYCPGVDLLVFSPKQETSPKSYSVALKEVFKIHDEVIVSSDDIVLTPHSYQLLMEDIERLKEKHGDKLGIVAAHSDFARQSQNIRYQQSPSYSLNGGQWSWEGECREVKRLSPFFHYLSKRAFEDTELTPLEWYSDDVMCEDLNALGYTHYISRCYVHHAGSQTIGKDFHRLHNDAMPWLVKNRPQYLDLFFGEGTRKNMETLELTAQEIDLKKKLKICVYAISKNESSFVQRFVESAIGADHIMIADTGSTDGTQDKARIHGATVHDICISPWRFDHARNAALALVPRDIDICISLDLDEVMEPGWREEIERVWEPGVTTRLRYMFDWGCGIKFQYEKIHHRHGYHWHHPCHEYPRPDGRTNEIYAYTNMLLVSHHPDPTKSRGQYLDLLKLSIEEDPHCPRNAFYYARELMFYRHWDQSIKECNRYLALPTATWQNERCYAFRVMGKCYDELGDPRQAELHYMKAAGEAPNTREPWCELAMLMYRQARWAECYAFSMRALEIKERDLVYTCDPAVWGHWAHDLASISAWRLGLKDIALEQAKLAYELTPGDQRLKDNLELIEKEMSTDDLAK